MEERYNEMRQVVQTNAVLSVGLCLFHAASTGGLECVLLLLSLPHGKYRGARVFTECVVLQAHKGSDQTLIARPYNFLIFPGTCSVVHKKTSGTLLARARIGVC